MAQHIRTIYEELWKKIEAGNDKYKGVDWVHLMQLLKVGELLWVHMKGNISWNLQQADWKEDWAIQGCLENQWQYLQDHATESVKALDVFNMSYTVQRRCFLLMQYNEEVANSRPSSLQLGENDIDQEEAQIQDLSKDVLEQFGDKNCGLLGWVNLWLKLDPKQSQIWLNLWYWGLFW